MVNQKNKTSDLELAKQFASWDLNKESKNIVVTLPDGGVYLNMTLEDAKAHPVLGTKKIISVKQDGKIIESEKGTVYVKPEKTDVKTPFEAALIIAKPFLDKTEALKTKSIRVTFPDCAVFVDSDNASVSEYANRKGLMLVTVFENGKPIQLKEESDEEKKPKNYKK